MADKKINILGTEYILIRRDTKDDVKLANNNGYCETYSKKLVVANIDDDEQNLENVEMFVDKVIRHEIVHAFLHESGLDNNSDWARNEEVVDWIALQLPRLTEACKDYM